MIAVDLSKQKVLDFDPKAIQQSNFTGNLDREGNTRVYFILEEAKETVLDFSQGIVKVLSFQSVIKNESDVVLRISSSMVGNAKNNTNFPHKLLFTDRQVANVCKAFSNNLSRD